MESLRRLYAGRKVLVTGDTGFKGAWLSLWLSELGARVVGYALPPERPNDLFPSLGLDRLIEHVDGDVRDLSALQAVFSAHQPEFCFHLAAQALVRRSYDEAKLTFDTNVGGAVNVLEAARNTASLRSLVFVTSDKCYRNREWVWGYRECDELGGRDPYSASKAAAEIVFSSYVDSFFPERSPVGLASARAGNVIGGGDWSADRIVPDCLRALAAGEPIRLRNPAATRPWQHVLEPLGAYLTLAARLHEDGDRYRGAWNFGPAAAANRSVDELARALVAGWGAGQVEHSPQAAAHHEATLLHLNCDKANHLLDWHPRWNFDRTVAETVHWYREVREGRSTMDVTRAQIESYMRTEHD